MTCLAALALPGSALAANSTSLDGANTGGTADGSGPFYEGAAISYSVSVVSTSGNDLDGNPFTTRPAGELVVTYDAERLRYDGNATQVIFIGPATPLVCDDAVEGELTCPVGSAPAGFPSTYTIPLIVEEGEYQDGGFDQYDVTTDVVLRVDENESDETFLSEDSTIVDSTPACDGELLSVETVAQTRAAGTQSASFTCESAAGIDEIVRDSANEGPHTGTLSDDGTDGTLTWTPDPALLASGRAILDTYVFTASAATFEAITTTVYVTFVVQPQTDLAVTSDAPASLEVPAGGFSRTITATVVNNGPDVHEGSGLGFWVPANATFVSATVANNAGTCDAEGFDFGDGRRFHACSGPDLAAGAAQAYSLTVRYTPGVKGLTLPTSSAIAVDTQIRQSGGPETPQDPVPNNNALTAEIALVAAKAAPTSTQPSGTTGPDTFRGGATNDTFDGGAGDDVFDGGAGNDTFYGGTGDDSGFGGTGDDLLFGGLGTDRLVGGDGTDKLHGQDGADRLFGSTGGDFVNGGPGNDVVRGGTGADRVYCGSGTDIATGDNGMDLLGCRDGKPGDTINGGNGLDICVGDAGDRFLACETIFRIA